MSKSLLIVGELVLLEEIYVINFYPKSLKFLSFIKILLQSKKIKNIKYIKCDCTKTKF